MCSDRILARLDEQLDNAYRAALAGPVRARPGLRDAQRKWLASHRDPCRSVACLRAAYESRLRQLLDESTATADTIAIAAMRAVEPYATGRARCDGLPKLAIGMAPGMCAGLVAGPEGSDPDATLRMPRALLQLDADTWLLSDLGAFGKQIGSVWRLRLARERPVRPERLLGGLRYPHTLARGPDGRIYVGEMGRIFRFDPGAANPAATVHTVVGKLPDNRLSPYRHPLPSFVFDTDGALLVNVGSPSDQCLDARGRRKGETCEESETGERAASLRRYAATGPGRWSPRYTVYARGLRNSLALARHPSGTLLQAENGYDFEQRLLPHEELNIIRAGRHYGWPYCFDNNLPTPGWTGTHAANCGDGRYTAPALLLPPHASPLALLWYHGTMFPELEGRLLMSWHGFRSTGGRIVAFATDARGVPLRTPRARFPAWPDGSLPYPAANAATARVLTTGWDKVVGLRPQGSPVGLAIAHDGAIWTTDDRAGVVIRIARDAKQEER